ncbi:MAG: cbb3-type cytochrome c oxidase subunit I, partial [Acetobacteraceae bacterium]
MSTSAAFQGHAEHAEHVGYGHGHSPGFFRRWFCSTNHKDIGTLYICFSIFSGFVAGTLSILMRWQLIVPDHHTFIANGQTWNSVITAHGLIMIFFTLMPGLIGGFGNWFVPLLIGAPDMAFPRLNNISFWLLPFGLALV